MRDSPVELSSSPRSESSLLREHAKLRLASLREVGPDLRILQGQGTFLYIPHTGQRQSP